MAYIYSTKESFHDGDTKCTPTCGSWGFDLAERTYRDRSQDLMRYESIMRRRGVISDEETLFSTEITIEIDDLKVISEEVVYPLGKLLSSSTVSNNSIKVNCLAMLAVSLVFFLALIFSSA